jgi:outer membrane protein assembly factor BamB
MRSLGVLTVLCLATLPAFAQGPARDWPLFGGSPARNMVNLLDKNVLTDWSVQAGQEKNIKWQANLGKLTYGGPVVAGGRVFVGTNNARPRDPNKKGFKSVLMCFDEVTGRFLWQIVHDAPGGRIYRDVLQYGLLSTPVVAGNRVYYLLPQCVVICANVENGKLIWEYDMTKELGVLPYHCSNCSPLVVGNHLFLVTGNGIDEETGLMHDARAPSFIALTLDGKLTALKSNLPGERVFEGQWSNPVFGVIQGKPQVIFPGGDGALYSFEPDSGKLIWEFHCYPRKAGKRRLDNYFVSTPVFHDNKVYVGLGMQPGNDAEGPRRSYFLCIDATKIGDVSPTSLDPQAKQDKNSALLWSYGGLIMPAPKRGERQEVFGRTMSTCAVHDGLVYIPEERGFMHCLDAFSGKRQWIFDLKTPVWGSPYYVDGKVYVGNEDGEMIIFQAGKEMKIINTIEMGDVLRSTPVVANGVMFITTQSKLFAIAAK